MENSYHVSDFHWPFLQCTAQDILAKFRMAYADNDFDVHSQISQSILERLGEIPEQVKLHHMPKCDLNITTELYSFEVHVKRLADLSTEGATFKEQFFLPAHSSTPICAAQPQTTPRTPIPSDPNLRLSDWEEISLEDFRRQRPVPEN
jgi:hypothetical protein